MWIQKQQGKENEPKNLTFFKVMHYKFYLISDFWKFNVINTICKIQME